MHSRALWTGKEGISRGHDRVLHMELCSKSMGVGCEMIRSETPCK
jgi:hypothetical protein